MIRLVLGTALALIGPAAVSAQMGPDRTDVPPAELPRCPAPLAGVCYEFRAGTDGWHVPSWASAAAAHVRTSPAVVRSSEGTDGVLRIEASFPGGRWGAAVIELREIRDLDLYQTLVARVRVGSEGEFAARWAAVVGSHWSWVEASEATPLDPSGWTEVSIPIERLGAELDHVRRLLLRVESAGSGGSGVVPVEFDFVRLLIGSR